MGQQERLSALAMRGSKQQWDQLHVVLHVPGLEFNLASVMKMDEKGACVVVEGGKCHVRLHRVVLEASMRDGLCKIRTFSAFRRGHPQPLPPKQVLERQCGTSV
jgi:hypothetical protein